MDTSPAMILINEVHDIDDQLWSFIGLAVAVILLSWALIKISKWLAMVADALALLSAWAILHEVWWTELWLDHSRGETLVPGYLRVAFAAVAFPILTITALLIVKRGSPNQRPEGTPGVFSPTNPSQVPGAAPPEG